MAALMRHGVFKIAPFKTNTNVNITSQPPQNCTAPLHLSPTKTSYFTTLNLNRDSLFDRWSSFVCRCCRREVLPPKPRKRRAWIKRNPPKSTLRRSLSRQEGTYLYHIHFELRLRGAILAFAYSSLFTARARHSMVDKFDTAHEMKKSNFL